MRRTAARRSRRHLLSGLIECAECGSSYVISGKDFYRCASHKEQVSCSNRLAIREDMIEAATLGTLQTGLLTEEHARILVEEFTRETNRLAAQQDCRDIATETRLAQIELALAKLEQNMLAGVLSPTLARLLADRKAARATLQARRAAAARSTISSAQILPHPALLALFEEQVAKLSTCAQRGGGQDRAAAVVVRPVESVTIYPAGEESPEAEVMAKVSHLLDFAETTNAPRRVAAGRLGKVVAGTGFEPVTFRL